MLTTLLGGGDLAMLLLAAIGGAFGYWVRSRQGGGALPAGLEGLDKVLARLAEARANRQAQTALTELLEHAPDPPAPQQAQTQQAPQADGGLPPEMISILHTLMAQKRLQEASALLSGLVNTQQPAAPAKTPAV